MTKDTSKVNAENREIVKILSGGVVVWFNKDEILNMAANKLRVRDYNGRWYSGVGDVHIYDVEYGLKEMEKSVEGYDVNIKWESLSRNLTNSGKVYGYLGGTKILTMRASLSIEGYDRTIYKHFILHLK